MMWTPTLAYSTDESMMDADERVEELFFVARFAPSDVIRRFKKQWGCFSIYLIRITHNAPRIQKSSIFGVRCMENESANSRSF